MQLPDGRSPLRPASVGRSQHSHVAGRTQLITLPARAGCTATTPMLEWLRVAPRVAARAPGNGTTTLIGSSTFGAALRMPDIRSLSLLQAWSAALYAPGQWPSYRNARATVPVWVL